MKEAPATLTLAEAVRDLFARLLDEGDSIRCVADGSSMEPCIRKGDVVTVRPATFPEVRIGHILVFRSHTALHGTPLTAHRVIKKSTRPPRPRLYVRGDANFFGNWVTPEAIAGTITRIQRGNQVIDLTRRWSRLRSYARAYLSECKVLWLALRNASRKVLSNMFRRALHAHKALPFPGRERAIEAYATTAQINRQRLDQLDSVLKQLESSGIEVLPLKGADLLGRAYGGALGLRPMVDVDLLFHREDLPRIEGVLEANGFLRRVDGNPSYVSANQCLALDMISDIWYLERIDPVWQRSVHRQVAGRLRRTMHPEDALIYLVAYQTIHRGRLGLQMALDVTALLDAEGQSIDWGNVVYQAKTRHLHLPLYHGLAYARDKTGARIPAWVLQALRSLPSQPWIGSVYERLLQPPGIPQLGYFLLVASRPGWRAKLMALREMFVPPREFLAYRYGARSRWDRVVARLTRPAHLVGHSARLLARIAWRLLVPRNA